MGLGYSLPHYQCSPKPWKNCIRTSSPKGDPAEVQSQIVAAVLALTAVAETEKQIQARTCLKYIQKRLSTFLL